MGYSDELLKEFYPQDAAPQPVAPTDPVSASESVTGYASELLNEFYQPTGATTEQATLRNAPWWYRVLDTGIRAAEPLRVPGDLTRSLAYDIFLRRPGERSEFFTFLRQLPYYAPGGERPKMLAPGEEFAEALGLEGTAASVVGIGLEVLMDPFAIADVWGTLAYKGAQKVATKEITKAFGREVGTLGRREVQKFLRVAEENGDEDLAALLRLQVDRMALADKMRSPVEWIPEPTRRAIGRTTLEILDKVPTPLVARMTKPGGVTIERHLSLAEAVTTKSTYGARYEGTPFGEFWRKYFGEVDTTKLARGAEEATPSAFDLAKQKGELSAMRVYLAARKTHQIFREATGLSADKAPETYFLWSKTVADWIDNLQASSKLTKRTAAGFGIPDPNELLDFSRSQQEIYKRMQAIAKQSGLDADTLFKAAKDAARENLRAAMDVGWELADMTEFSNAVRSFAEATGMTYDEIGEIVWSKAYGRELSEEGEKLYESFRKYWDEMPTNLAQIDPLEYIRGLSEGYYRRVLGVHAQDPTFLKRMAQDLRGGVRWMPARQLRADDFVDQLERIAGKEAADKVASYLIAFGDGSLTPYMIARHTGVDADAITEAAIRSGVTDLSPKMRKIVEESLAEGGQRGLRPSFTLQGQRLFAERKLTDEAVDAWLPVAKLEDRAASLAVAGRRAIQGKEVIKQTYNLLSEYGLVGDTPDALRALGVEIVFKLPESKSLGPLAGKYIPRQIAETFLRSVESGDPGLFQRFLNNVRVAWLAGPPTISRNVSGGVTMMWAAGVTPQEMAKYAPETAKLYNAYRKHGDLSQLGPGHELLKLFGEGQLSGEAGDMLTRGLSELLATAKPTPTSDWLTKLDAYSKRVRDVMTGRPLFDYFQMSEDYMRLMTFLIVRDRLKAKGLNSVEAGLQAAQIANNILFDYSSQPEMVRVLRKFGLWLFPAFPVFNLGRTTQLAVKRPAAIVVPDRITAGTIQLLNEDEREMASRVVHDSWLEDEQPVFVPTGNEGEFIVIPTRQLMPQFAWTDLLRTDDPLRGGVLASAIEAYTAFQKEGEAIWSGKYGERVFDPLRDVTPGQRAVATTKFLGRQYAPGHLRYLTSTYNNLSKYYRSSNPDVLRKALGDRYGYGFSDALFKAIGVSVNRLGTGHDVENLQRIQQEFTKNYSVARSRMVQAAIAGDLKASEQAAKAMQNAVLIYQRDMCQYYGGRFVDGRCVQE